MGHIDKKIAVSSSKFETMVENKVNKTKSMQSKSDNLRYVSLQEVGASEAEKMFSMIDGVLIARIKKRKE